jgi:hypothetical protein
LTVALAQLNALNNSANLIRQMQDSWEAPSIDMQAMHMLRLQNQQTINQQMQQLRKEVEPLDLDRNQME